MKDEYPVLFEFSNPRFNAPQKTWDYCNLRKENPNETTNSENSGLFLLAAIVVIGDHIANIDHGQGVCSELHPRVLVQRLLHKLLLKAGDPQLFSLRATLLPESYLFKPSVFGLLLLAEDFVFSALHLSQDGPTVVTNTPLNNEA